MKWLILLFVATVAHADPTGFAHRIHDLKITTSGAESLPCARCHVLAGGKLVGKPNHATCFTAACHAPGPPKVKSGKLCDACHAPAATKAFYPPYSIDRDFRVDFGHAFHAPVACTTCHAAKAPAVHARCLGCHDGKATFPMTKCEPCHVAASGEPEPPQLKPAFYKMSSFSHPKHAARGPAGKACTTCHATLAQSNEEFLPRPTAETCATSGCHDGKGAFPVTEKCSRCHVDARNSIDRPPVLRYSHQQHATANLPCSSCHKITNGEITSTGHAACVTCHAAEFGSQKTKICLACHSSIEPWRKLIVDRVPGPTEFGADLDHTKHAQPCATCHKLDVAGHELRTPRGHAACSGCHATQAPTLDKCEACHTAGLQSARDISRRAAAWSVRQQFRHGAHPGPCADCHVDMSAPSIANLATPAKSTCARCHEGRTAFKLTGTSCTRCHLGPL